MNSTEVIVTNLEGLGFVLVANGDKLKIRSNSPITPEVYEKLTPIKGEVLAFLRRRQAQEVIGKAVACESVPAQDRTSIRLEEANRLYRERGWVQIWSGHLGCTIYLIRDRRVRVPDTNTPVYTEKEIRVLKGLSLNELRTLHEAKSIFGGEVSMDHAPLGPLTPAEWKYRQDLMEIMQTPKFGLDRLAAEKEATQVILAYRKRRSKYV